MSDLEENDFLDVLISEGTDEDWADFWVSDDPTEFLMNDNKIEEIHG